MICQDDSVLGFISLSRDSNALYIRELHMLEQYRGLGAGSWVLQQMALKARTLGLLRLTVFKNNPAKQLYVRMGLRVVGEEDSFWRMERVCPSS